MDEIIKIPRNIIARILKNILYTKTSFTSNFQLCKYFRDIGKTIQKTL